MFDWLTSLSSHRHPAGCRIAIDGAEITDAYRFVSEVEVDAARARASTARVVFVAAAEESGAWTIQDDDAVRSGATIKIEATFGDRAEEVFRGFIQRVSPSYPENRGDARVTLTCRDETLQLDRGHDRRFWGTEDIPSSDMLIVNTLLSENGLIPAPDNQAGQSGLVLAQNGSAIDFLQERARENGYELYSWAGSVYFGPPRLGLSPQPAIMVYAGKRTNCLTFEVSDDIHHADELSFEIAPESGSDPETVTVMPNLDLLGLRPAGGNGTSLGTNSWRMSRTTTPDRARAEAQAQAHVDEEQMRVSATGQLDGSLYGHVLRFGMPVVVRGPGVEFGGRYYTDEVKHSFTAAGYRQDFKLIRNGYGDDGASAGGLLDAVMGG